MNVTITSDRASISSGTIQIAGTKSLTDTANASGVASLSVNTTGAGTCTLTATDVAGAVLATQTVLGVSADAAAPTTGPLPRTGFDVMGFALWGGLFVLVGAGALIVVKRRRPAQVRA